MSDVIFPEHTQIHDHVVSPRERRIAEWCHLSSFCGFFLPLGQLFVPFMIWWIYRDKSTYIYDQGREVLNFQLSIIIYSLASLLLWFVFIGIFFNILLIVFAVIAVVIAAKSCSQGRYFRYPLTLRIL